MRIYKGKNIFKSSICLRFSANSLSMSFNEQWVHVGQDTKHGGLVSLYKILINFKFTKINMWTMVSKYYTDRIETKCVTSKLVEWGKRKTDRREKYQIIKGNKEKKKQTLKRN